MNLDISKRKWQSALLMLLSLQHLGCCLNRELKIWGRFVWNYIRYEYTNRNILCKCHLLTYLVPSNALAYSRFCARRCLSQQIFERFMSVKGSDRFCFPNCKCTSCTAYNATATRSYQLCTPKGKTNNWQVCQQAVIQYNTTIFITTVIIEHCHNMYTIIHDNNLTSSSDGIQIQLNLCWLCSWQIPPLLKEGDFNFFVVWPMKLEILQKKIIICCQMN